MILVLRLLYDADQGWPCFRMASRSQTTLGKLLRLVKKREVEVNKGRLVVRFLARRLLNTCINDIDLPIVVGSYLPELQAQLKDAHSKGLLNSAQVRSPWLAPGQSSLLMTYSRLMAPSACSRAAAVLPRRVVFCK